MSQPRVYVEISLKHTQPTKEQTARSSGVHAALCSVKGTVVSLCVCVSHICTSPAFPSEALLPWIRCQTHRFFNDYLTRKKRHIKETEGRDREPCLQYANYGGGMYCEAHTEKCAVLECLSFTKFHIIPMLMHLFTN